MKNLCFIKLVLVFSFLLLIISSCSKQEFDEDNPSINNELLSQADLRDGDDSIYEVEYILDYLKANAPIDWAREKDAKLLYSIGYYTDSSYIVGYKPKAFTDFENGFNINETSKPEWQNAKENILNQFDFHAHDVLQDEGEGNDIFPAVLVKSPSFETLERLMEMDELFFIEPAVELFRVINDPQVQQAFYEIVNTSGCGCSSPNELPSNDFKEIQPGMKMPWNYEFNGINEYAIDEEEDPSITYAWDISSGDNIGVAVIDSGVSYEQENLNYFGAFDDIGLSFERYEERRDFLGVEIARESVGISNSGNSIIVSRERPIQDINRAAHDRCGHGTRQAGIVAGPRGVDGNSVGIAYNCDLYNYRAVHNPIILTMREKLAVSRALTAAAMEDNIKIISMAIAQPPLTDPSTVIENAINLAYNADKMIVCAAGTLGGDATNWVLFPANHENTIAVTGIQYPESYPGPLEDDDPLCNICFGGPEVNFAVIMQDGSNTDRTTLAVTCQGDVPAYSTGSSSATASLSGMAALIWSNLGNTAPRSDVIEKMRLASSNPDQNDPHPYLGHGWINVRNALE